jgi:hypothetical protein
MGRKNRRIQENPDKNFIKFMDSINKRNRTQKPNKQYVGTEGRNQKRLSYALEQFGRERIQYEVLNEEKGVVKVQHQTTGVEYIYYAFTGTLKEGDNQKARGLWNVLEFLYT